MRSAGIDAPRFTWRRFDYVGWVAGPGRVARLEGGLPAASPPLTPEVSLRQRPQHLANAAWVLARAAAVLEAPPDARPASRRALEVLVEHATDAGAGGRVWLELEGSAPSVCEVAFVLLTLCETSDLGEHRNLADGLVRTLVGAIDRHGRIATHREQEAADDGAQDYFPAQVLLALGRAAEVGLWVPDQERIDRALGHYRHRFLYQRSWGHIAWLPQAFAVWWRLTGQGHLRDLVYEVADWALEHQSQHCGGFITGHQHDTPGCTSAVYLEGIAAALQLARATGDEERSQRYRHRAGRAVQFVDRLIYQDRDGIVLPRLDRARRPDRHRPTLRNGLNPPSQGRREATAAGGARVPGEAGPKQATGDVERGCAAWSL